MSINTAGMDRIIAGLPDAIERGVEATANVIAITARRIAPYDSTADHKHLNQSIEVQDGDDALSRRVVAGVDLPDARAVFQEYGTSKMAAQPYMTPAAEQHRAELAINVATQVKRLIG